MGADGGDEVVDARHLDEGEEGDEEEPGGGDLRGGGTAVEGAPDVGAGRIIDGEEGSGVGRLVEGGVFRLFGKFAGGLVGVMGHDEELCEQDEGGDEEVEEEELLGGKGAVGGLVEQAVDEEDGAAGVEGARQQREDEAGVGGEGVAELEGGDEDERSAQRQTEVGGHVGIEQRGQVGGEGHPRRAEREEGHTHQAGHARAEAVEDRSHG